MREHTSAVSRQGKFCRAYLRTMNPELAARESGSGDGFALLETERVQRCLDRMREAAAGQLRREDVLRHLAQLAFGRSDDGVRLALQGREADLDELDLTAVAEIRVTDKGGIELKFLDRVRALETLYTLLESDGTQGSARELYQALTETSGAEEGGWEHG